MNLTITHSIEGKKTLKLRKSNNQHHISKSNRDRNWSPIPVPKWMVLKPCHTSVSLGSIFFNPYNTYLSLAVLDLSSGSEDFSLPHAGSVVAERAGLVAPRLRDLGSLPCSHVPCVGRQILNHWTTREVPEAFIWKCRFPDSTCTGSESLSLKWCPGICIPLKDLTPMVFSLYFEKEWLHYVPSLSGCVVQSKYLGLSRSGFSFLNRSTVYLTVELWKLR